MIKKIYFFWYQGIENAPIIVKKCLDSWYVYNPDWEIIVLDSENCNLTYNNLLSLTHFSDILRLTILKDNGGLWVDATCFCNCPLNDWILQYDKLFMFKNFNIKDKMISNFFIYSEKNNYIITKLYEETMKIYETNVEEFTKNYFIEHDIFQNLYYNNFIFKYTWDNISNCNKQNNHMMYFDLYKKGNLHIENNGFLEPINEKIKKMIIQKKKFIFKLSYKCDFENKYNSDTILAFLFDTIK
jgi:mannosyltransferase OCH1-like enzyme